MNARSIHAMLTLLPILALACGGSSPSGEGGSGAGGASPTTGSGAGTSTSACVHPSDHQCAQITGTVAEADQWKALCTADGATPADACSTTNLIGCCKTATSSVCFYTGIGDDESKLMEACASSMSTWSETP